MLRIRANEYPVILPRIRDPRLHVAAVVITLHVLGQLGLHFWVSVPQILSAILTAAIIELTITFRRTRSFVWPASAMLTGSGVALILRVPGTPPNDHWSTHSWYVFAGVAAFSLLTKYAIRYRGSHLFNPSNVGLVVTFVVLGSTRVEPLDFWWAPLNSWMIMAYTVILMGGLLITRNLRLLVVAVTFWITMAVSLGLVAASGHCMTARWAFTPVCGFDYWRVIMFSPELLIFLFFMITDPKTVPAGRVGRVLFGALVAVVSTLLMAPQSDEFGTKVGLLGGLVVMCAARPLFDRLVPAPGSGNDRVRRFASLVAIGGRPGGSILRPIVRVGAIGALVVALGASVVAVATSTRTVVGLGSDDVLRRVPHAVDPSTFPTITVEQGVLDWNHEIAGPGARAIVLTLAENLDLENQALLRADPSILEAVDHGDRLDAMRLRIQDAEATGATVIERYSIDDVNVTLLVPFGRQDGLSLGLESSGTKTTETYDAEGAMQTRTSSPFETTFVVRRATGDRWLNVDELPFDNAG
jgi:Na+-translocating ferredoxin:NAD+ oxidoreductase RnfD subunit